MKTLVKKIGLTAALLASMAFVGACATASSARHSYLMRGSIIEKDAQGIYLCIGSKDGAAVGQVLRVHKIEPQPASPRATPRFKRVETGTVKITEILDEHFARATVVSGAAEKNSIVELE